MSERQALALKPDFLEAVKRWEAFFAGEITDRPVVVVTSPRRGQDLLERTSFRQRVFGDIDTLINDHLAIEQCKYFGGEAIPATNFNMGPDTIAVYCGGTMAWLEESGNTNWSVPFVESWDDHPVFAVDENNAVWRRTLEIYRKAAAEYEGALLLGHLDLHTNMDLLAAARGPERLCLDLVDRPAAIDRAMESTVAVFKHLWESVSEAGKMKERGYAHRCFSARGTAMLQCDFSCMISPAMFRRWVLPVLEEEAAIAGDVVYHWDGPDALVHVDDLVRSRGIYVFAFVPGHGNGRHVDYLELYKKVQSHGKAVWVSGTIDEVKQMHRELQPDKTVYELHVDSEQEADAILDWFVKNT